jgi:hypothetical protein
MTRGDAGHGVILADNDVLLRGVIRSVLVHAEQKVWLKWRYL